MAEQKTEKPTQKRLRDAREKGEVAYSPDVSSTAILIAVFAVIGVFWPWFQSRLSELFLIPLIFLREPFQEAYLKVTFEIGQRVMMICLPVLAAAFIAAIFGGVIQVGFNFTIEPIIPKMEKFNPVSKLKQIFGRHGLIELLKNVIKISFLGGLLAWLIRGLIDPIMRLPYAGPTGIIQALGPVMQQLAIVVCLTYIGIAAIDLFLKRKEHTKKLMMTKHEVKQEHKEMEGNPQIKSRRKELHKELLSQEALTRVKGASVLVTNPTHLAIALYYDWEGKKTKLPIVLTKGEGYLAQQMVEIAKREGIPVMRNVPLAHSLFNEATVDHYIPESLLEPVAEVLRWVRQQREEWENR